MKIRILPDDIANRIAAGEVVERPASVVKELVENALDAGARKITVDVEEGGRKRIQVTDDGEGMTPEDARACFGRHATSKLYEPDDLFAIKTLGFRGEALPSIASVSHLVLETQAEASVGTVIEIAGGRVVSEREQAFPRGTEITVDDLFFNVPARRFPRLRRFLTWFWKRKPKRPSARLSKSPEAGSSPSVNKLFRAERRSPWTICSSMFRRGANFCDPNLTS